MNFRITAMCTDYQSCVTACNGGQGFQCLQAFGKAPTDATKLSALKRGCELRDPPSCGVLGIGYMNGELGLPQDEAMGLRFTSQACDSAIPNSSTHKIMEVVAMACVSAGRSYYKSEDGKRALVVFDRACPTEFQACRGAASVLLKGMGGVTPDNARAASYMKRSCDAGDTQACEYTGPR
jgi:TPR repeat protein